MKNEIQEYLSMLASLGLNSKLMKKEFKVTRGNIELETNWLIHSVISMFLKKVFSYKSEGVSTNLDIYIENQIISETKQTEEVTEDEDEEELEIRRKNFYQIEGE